MPKTGFAYFQTGKIGSAQSSAGEGLKSSYEVGNLKLGLQPHPRIRQERVSSLNAREHQASTREEPDTNMYIRRKRAEL